MVSREEVDTYMKKFVDSMEAPEDKDKAEEYMKQFVEEMHESPDKADEYMKKFVEETRVNVDKLDDYTEQLVAMSEEEYKVFYDKYRAEFISQYKVKTEAFLKSLVNDTKTSAELGAERLRNMVNDVATSTDKKD